MARWLQWRRMVPAVVAVAALAAAMLAAAAAPAFAAPAADKPRAGSRAKEEAKGDPRVWIIVRAEDTYVMRYGLPRAADPVFAVACQPGAQLIQFTVEVASGKVRAGDGVALALAAGKRRLELAASAFRGASEGKVVVEAAVSLDPRVLDLFSEGDSLTVRMPGATESYPLGGAKSKLPDFRRACLSGAPATPDRR